MSLPLLKFPCTIKSRSSLLTLAHPDGLGKRAVNSCGGVHVCYHVNNCDYHCCTTADISAKIILGSQTTSETKFKLLGMVTNYRKKQENRPENHSNHHHHVITVL